MVKRRWNGKPKYSKRANFTAAYGRDMMDIVSNYLGTSRVSETRSGKSVASENPTNQHTQHQLTQGIDQSMSLYNRRRVGGKSARKLKIRKIKRIKKKKRLLKLINPKKSLNVFYEMNTAVHTVNTAEAGSAWINQYPIDLDSMGVWFRGNLWGTQNDVNNIITKLQDIDWSHAGQIQNQNKLMNTKAYVKTTVIGTYKPSFDAAVFPHGLKFDVYECIAAQDITDADYNTPNRAWASVLNNVQTWNGSSRPVFTRKAYTPFESPSFGEWWKIQNVTRYHVGNTDTVHFKFHQKGVVDYEKFHDKWAVKGKTKGLLIVFHPVYSGETTNPARQEGNFIFCRKHKFYNIGMESSVVGVPNISVANAITHTI